MTAAARGLLAVFAYNGRHHLAGVLASAEPALRRAQAAGIEIDGVVFDDCSPEPGFHDWLRNECDTWGFELYRSPRNLGIVRNFSLAMGVAVHQGYDFVVLSNSDVVFPEGAMLQLATIASETNDLGAVMPWSNGATIYSLAREAADHLAAPEAVQEMDTALQQEFGAETVSIPCAVGFCLLLPTAAIETVGLMDPIFGRGYCEENDWCLRARHAGLRVALAPGTFVYHAERGSTVEAGLLRSEEQTSAQNEGFLDWRHPTFRADVARFGQRGPMKRLRERALGAVMAQAGQHGYVLELSGLPTAVEPDHLQVNLHLETRTRVRIDRRYRGMLHTRTASLDDLGSVFADLAPAPPSAVRVREAGPLVPALRSLDPSLLKDTIIPGYPVAP